MLALLTIHRPDGTGRTGLADGIGGWHWIPDQAALNEVQAATGLSIREVTEDLAGRAYNVVLDPPQATAVTLTDADLEDIATLVVRRLFAIFAQLGTAPTGPGAPTA